MKTTLLGIDLGTTNIKSVLIDLAGEVLAVHRERVTYSTDANGRCEFSASEFATALRRCIAAVCETSGTDPRAIAAISYGSQANTFLLLDGTGSPLTPLVSWQDARVEYPDERIADFFAQDGFLETTGLGIWSRQLAVVKIAALQREVLWPSVGSVMTISDYMIFLLTGERVGDSSTASMLGLYDIHNHDWWSEALDAAGIDRDVLSVPVQPGVVAGEVSLAAAGGFGLKSGIPVVAGGLDHYVAAVGAGAATLADACESTGTVVACIFTGEGIGPLAGACFGPSTTGNYLLTFDDFGGTILERYREKHCPELSFAEMDEFAEAAGAGAGGTSAVIDETGELSFSRHPDRVNEISSKESRNERIGRETRAVLEATAFRLDRLVRAAVGGERNPDVVVSTGGGAKSTIWTQIKASITGSRFITVQPAEPAAYGAAYLAGRGAGLVESSETGGIPESWIAVRSAVEPDAQEHLYYTRFRDHLEAR